MKKWEKWNELRNEFSKYENVKSELILGNEVNNVKFSIVIPMYKRIDYLEEAIQSAVQQDYKELYEIAIFDNEWDASQNKLDLIQKFTHEHSNICYYQNRENLGMFGNFNRAISMAKGEWVVVLHDDDMLKENYLSTMDTLTSGKMGMIAPHPEILDMRNIEKRKQNSKLTSIMKIFHGLKPIYLKDFFNISGVSPICALINKEKFIDVGGYDESLFPSSDMGGVMKLGTKYPIAYYPDKLFYYRYDVNESLNEKTSRDFIGDTYEITYELGKFLNYSESKIQKICGQNVAASISYSLISDKESLFKEYFSKYKIPFKYCKPLNLKCILLKNSLNVMKRLLRKWK